MNLSALKDLDHEVGIDHTDHTDDPSGVCNVDYTKQVGLLGYRGCARSAS